MANIIILDELSEDGLNLLRSAAGIEVEVPHGLSKAKREDGPGRIRRCNLPQRRENHRRVARRQPTASRPSPAPVWAWTISTPPPPPDRVSW